MAGRYKEDPRSRGQRDFSGKFIGPTRTLSSQVSPRHLPFSPDHAHSAGSARAAAAREQHAASPSGGERPLEEEDQEQTGKDGDAEDDRRRPGRFLRVGSPLCRRGGAEERER